MIWFRRVRSAVRQAPPSAILERLESRRLLSGSPANLVETFLTPFPSSVLRGTGGSVTVGVSNAGFGKINGRIQISLLATTDGTIAGAVAMVRTINPVINLSRGQFQNFTLDFRYPPNLPSGSYKFIAVVDGSGEITQTPPSEQTVTIAPRFADLAAHFSQAPTFLTIGRMPGPQVLIILRNTGNAAATGQTTISLFESPTPTLGDDAVLLQTSSSMEVSIAPNGSQTLAITQNRIPLSASTGNEYVIAVLHTTTSSPERAASIQTATTPFTTSFATSLFTFLPASLPIPSTVPVSLTVSNGQTTAVRGDEDIDIYESPTPALTSDSLLLQTFSDRPIDLPVGGTQTYDLNLAVPKTAVKAYEFLVATLTPVSPLAANRTTESTIVAQSASAFGLGNLILPPPIK